MAIAAIGVLLAGCSGAADPGVETAPVSRSTVIEVVEAPAVVTARSSATVTASASGRVASIEVDDGDVVERGDVLLRLRSASARRGLKQAKQADAQAAQAASVTLPRTSVAASQQQADQAAAEAFSTARRAARSIPDPATRSAALARVAQAEAAYAAARSQGQQAAQNLNAGTAALEDALGSLAGAQRIQTKAAVAAAQAAVDGLVVRAPVAGVVQLGAVPGATGGDVSALIDSLPDAVQGSASSLLGADGGSASTTGSLSVGAPVSAGSTLASVTDISTLSVTASVDETDVLLVEPGVEADIELDAVPDASYAGVVLSIDVQPTTSGRGGVAYTVRLSLEGGTGADGRPAPRPRPGMSAVARLQVREAVDVLAVPAAAVFRDAEGEAVWVVESDLVERRAVTLGAQGVDTVEVTTGLSEGEIVIVRGADQVRDGQRVP